MRLTIARQSARVKVLHPALGVVVDGNSIIRRHLTLTWGSCIGANKQFEKEPFTIGNYCFLGANAIIMGLLRLGDRITVGAGAVVSKVFHREPPLSGFLHGLLVVPVLSYRDGYLYPVQETGGIKSHTDS